MGNSLTAADLGSRVSILYRLNDGGAQPFSEVVGVLQRVDRSQDADVYIIVRRDGSVAEVPEPAIVALKRLPAVRPRP